MARLAGAEGHSNAMFDAGGVSVTGLYKDCMPGGG
jgi:hypothetical protein